MAHPPLRLPFPHRPTRPVPLQVQALLALKKEYKALTGEDVPGGKPSKKDKKKKEPKPAKTEKTEKTEKTAAPKAPKAEAHAHAGPVGGRGSHVVKHGHHDHRAGTHNQDAHAVAEHTGQHSRAVEALESAQAAIASDLDAIRSKLVVVQTRVQLDSAAVLKTPALHTPGGAGSASSAPSVASVSSWPAQCTPSALPVALPAHCRTPHTLPRALKHCRLPQPLCAQYPVYSQCPPPSL